jgi:hypothetical protein
MYGFVLLRVVDIFTLIYAIVNVTINSKHITMWRVLVGCVVCFHRRPLGSHLRRGRYVNHRSSNEIRDYDVCQGRISRCLSRNKSVCTQDFKVMHG